ncbi:DNA polymerase III subunit alpha [Paraglaciecola hydrolytica]|uniref:DNA polymerase III subunit alpha n=1 Tax=Paraglaciecola hydrolytica TaxID=1799789 RepID=A0A148KMI5_9ALTE|nr:DNA polymerase III subunit alpha [Paraglaciecola hydrolytica]KXI27507.1 DNA polymerase III subunit alpha [Paraglaciecola hydrolytica]
MADTSFVHLRVHSDYSMLDGLNKIKPLVSHAKKLGMPAVAITDQMNMCGLVKFYGAAHSNGIKPIIGTDFWVKSSELEEQIFRLTLLAMNNDGYKNITLLISKAYLRGSVQDRAVIELDWLVEHSVGVIILSGGRMGDLGLTLTKGNVDATQRITEFYQQHFQDRYFLELTRTGRQGEEDYIHRAIAWAQQHDLPVVATNEVCFIEQQNFAAHEIRVAIHDGFTLNDPRRPKLYSEQQYFRTSEEMLELFVDIPEALQNTVEIAKRCNVTVTLGEYFLPKFPTGELTDAEYLVKVSEEGLEKRLAFLFPDEQVRLERRPEYDDRLRIEMEVINQMGFPGYFLIVMEFIQWSKDNGIPVGPGRGSGAGSLVAYAQGITDLDPLEFDLLFERFLNPERVSMPDFDVDFCMDRRDEVIEHVAELYGRQAVSQIITFGTMAAKAVVRDVGRVLGHPYGFNDRISKLIPPTPGMTLEKAFEEEPRLPELYAQDEDVKELIDMCRILEGVTRNAGKHAGGVVIAPTQITDFAPLYCDDEGKNPVTQFDKNDVEYAGLVKFDFLGLRTLTIIQWAIDMIASGRGIKVDISAIPLVDAKCFKLLQNAETTAVFQLESRGMKELIKRLRPDTFEDIIALVALFRPGPLQSGMVDNFIDRKHGREAISYPDAQYQHECLKEILEPTYGIILYQEQVMQIAQVMSGYSLGGADLLRRAMGKKNADEMAKQRESFETGAKDNGIDPDLAIKIFDLVEKFAGYGFNKSHSAAYALVSYQTLWLKTHYPAEFMAAVMSADMDNTDKIVTLVDECQRMGITILPPDLNAGRYKFTVDEQGRIVYGIGAIKGVGEGPIEAIIAAREQHQKFSDLFDFCAKVDIKKINKRVLEKLVYAGAFDSFGPHRASIMATLPDALAAADQHAKAESFGQSDMFGLLTTEPELVEQAFVDVPKWPDKVWLDGEKVALGLYLTGHPINQYLHELKHYAQNRLVDLKPTHKDQISHAVGLVINVRIMTNKRGKRWALVTLDDKSGRIDARFFPEMFEQYESLLQVDKILVISGQVSFDEFSGGNTIQARDAMDIVQAREKNAKGIQIQLESSWCNPASLAKLQTILRPYQGGSCPIQVHYRHPDAEVSLAFGAQWYITPEDELLYDLQQYLGASQVALVFH